MSEGEGWDGGIWGTAVRVRPRKLILSLWLMWSELAR